MWHLCKDVLLIKCLNCIYCRIYRRTYQRRGKQMYLVQSRNCFSYLHVLIRLTFILVENVFVIKYTSIRIKAEIENVHNAFHMMKIKHLKWIFKVHIVFMFDKHQFQIVFIYFYKLTNINIYQIQLNNWNFEKKNIQIFVQKYCKPAYCY